MAGSVSRLNQVIVMSKPRYQFQIHLRSRVWIIPVVLMLMVLSSCTRVEKISPVEDPGFWHTIQPGESLEQIARRYEVSRIELQTLNDIYDPRDIVPGMEVFIPRIQLIPPQSPEDQRVVQRRAKTFVWPAKGTISSGYGIRHGRMHQGIDLTKDGGRDIVAAETGTVIFAGTKKGYGKTIIIDHGEGFTTLYAHNSKLYVRRNNRVRRGVVIAEMGATGASKGIHLHFEVRLRNKPQNPLRYLAVR